MPCCEVSVALVLTIKLKTNMRIKTKRTEKANHKTNKLTLGKKMCKNAQRTQNSKLNLNQHDLVHLWELITYCGTQHSTAQNSTVLTIFRLILQTGITAQIMSSRGGWKSYVKAWSHVRINLIHKQTGIFLILTTLVHWNNDAGNSSVMSMNRNWKSIKTRRYVDEDSDRRHCSCGRIIGSVQRVVLGVMLITKARGECYRLRRHLTHLTLYIR